jgi:hypothetical protein
MPLRPRPPSLYRRVRTILRVERYTTPSKAIPAGLQSPPDGRSSGGPGGGSIGAHTRVRSTERAAGAGDAPTVDGTGGGVAHNDVDVAGAKAHVVSAADSQRLGTGASGSGGGGSSEGESGRSSSVGSEGTRPVESINEVDGADGNGTLRGDPISLEQYVVCGKHGNGVDDLV